MRKLVEDYNDPNKYRKVVKYIDGYKVTNIYPILTQEEHEEREQEILLNIYRIFSKENI